MVGAVFCKSENQGTHYFSHRHNSFNQRGFLSFISIFCETSLLHNIKTYGWAFEQCTISHGAICNICRYKARLGGDKIYRKTEMFFSCPHISSKKHNILNSFYHTQVRSLSFLVSHSVCPHCVRLICSWICYMHLSKLIYGFL